MKNKTLVLLLFSLHFITTAISQSSIPTFHNIGIYWSPADGGYAKEVFVQYKISGEATWIDGLSLKYNPILGIGIDPITEERYDKADYRGTIANVAPNTLYDIRLTLEDSELDTLFQEKTWKEEFPIGETTIPEATDIENTIYVIDGTVSSGTADAYHLIDGTDLTIDAHYETESDTGNLNQNIYIHDAEYVIVRGFELINGGKYGILMDNCKNVIIENCEITNWGDEFESSGFGNFNKSGIFSINGLAKCVIQRNKIHSPRWSSNSWADLHDPTSDPELVENYHPNGPQAIFIEYADGGGNNIIRYNEFYSTNGNFFNDIIGGSVNSSYTGFLGPDSDIYGNYLADGFDDAIEVEGGNRNVRVWNNYIENSFVGIGNAPTSIGPLYVWRNVFGESYSPEGSKFGTYGNFIKIGTTGGGSAMMNGYTYILNNTVLQPDGNGFGGIGTRKNEDGSASNRIMRHCISKNNIIEVRDYSIVNSISIRDDGHINPNFDYDLDYDLLNGGYPFGYEINGLEGAPDYYNSYPLFNEDTREGDFTLNTTSLGFDAGVIVPNFIISYKGLAPDMGAHEAGYDSILVYGVNATNFIFESLLDQPSYPTEKDISIYPNPTNKNLFILIPLSEENNTVEMFDISGKLILKKALTADKNSINLEEFDKGIYLVKVFSKNKIILKTSKIVLQ